MTEDQLLLRRYVRDGAPDALDELVRRYRDLVYSSALRQVRDVHLAEDVAQAVFIVLSKKASTIRQGVATGGWLLAVTRRAALNAMKKQAIQHRHERAAAKTEVFETAEANWEQIDPVLDSVMSRLPNKDRDAVVLRYFQDRSFAQVGAELGLSEDAARKRVGRALERLRGLLNRRGVHLGAAALGTIITAHAVKASPIALTSIAASSGAMQISKGVMTMMAWTKVKIAAAVLLVLSISGGVIVALAQQPQQTARDNPPAAPTTAPFDAAVAREAILLRFQALQNLSVSYHTESVSLLAAARAGRGPAAAPASRPADATFSGIGGVGGVDNSPRDVFLSRLGEKFRTETRLTRIQGSRATGLSDVTTTSIFNGQIAQFLQVVAGGGMDGTSGSIDPQPPRTTELVEWALGLGKGPSDYSRLTILDLELMDIVPGPDGRVLLNLENERKNTFQWEFRPEMGYAISAYRYLIGAEKQLNVEVVAEDFKQVQGLMLPATVRERVGSIRDGQWTETYRITATIKQYKLNDPENTDARYQMTWPAGTTVFDGRNESRYYVNADGKLISEDDGEREKYKTMFHEATAKIDWSSRTTFTPPVNGLVVGEYRRGFKENMLDLDAGRVLDRPQVPAPLPPQSPEDVARFEEETRAVRQRSVDTGADLTFIYTPGGKGNGWGIFMLGSFLATMPAEAWDKPNIDVLKSSFSQGEIGGTHLVTAPDIEILLGPEPKLPLVFAYRTRDGGVGMVRIAKMESVFYGNSLVTVDVMKVIQSGK